MTEIESLCRTCVRFMGLDGRAVWNVELEVLMFKDGSVYHPHTNDTQWRELVEKAKIDLVWFPTFPTEGRRWQAELWNDAGTEMLTQGKDPDIRIATMKAVAALEEQSE